MIKFAAPLGHTTTLFVTADGSMPNYARPYLLVGNGWEWAFGDGEMRYTDAELLADMTLSGLVPASQAQVDAYRR